MSTNEHNEEDFSGKYLKSNFLQDKFIRNFIRAVEITVVEVKTPLPWNLVLAEKK